MITFLTVVYVIVCIFLILVVLLQAGRGGGMGTAFGGSSQTVFGGAGAGNFLTRLTVIMAAAFMLLSATLSFLSSSSDKALEKAAQAVKAREDARNVKPEAKKKAGAKDTGKDLTSHEGAAAPAAPAEEAPVEGAPAEEGAAPAAPDPEGTLKAVDDALKAKPGATIKLKAPMAAPAAPAQAPAEAPAPAPAAPAPAAPAAPAPAAP
jgi:preprotein translocase subunit SecG